MSLININPNKCKAALVHVFTASGVVFGFLALIAAVENNIMLTIFWLAIAFFVDGVDGTLARKYKVSYFTPNIDGSVLDNVVDFFTYVLVPAFIMYHLNFLPEQVEIILISLILLVSCYTFTNKKLKTADFYFNGFPALWNLVVLYLYMMNTSQIMNACIIIFLSILTFTPIKIVHPFRVKHLKKTTLAMTFLWSLTTSYLLPLQDIVPIPDYKDSYIELSVFVYYAWILINVYFLITLIFRSAFKKDW